METKEAEKAKKAERGDGGLSVNRFARNQDNTVATDFSKLPSNIFDNVGGAAMHEIKGVNISDPAKIKAISGAMSKMLGEKIAAGGNEKQLDLLKNAKLKFDNIASGEATVDNLSLINSGATGYKSMEQKKKVKVHEEIHGFGARGKTEAEGQEAEKYVDEKTKEVMAGNLYSKRKEFGEKYKEARGEEARGVAEPRKLSEKKKAMDGEDEAEEEYGEQKDGGENEDLIKALEELTKEVKSTTTESIKLGETVTQGAGKIGFSLGRSAMQTRLGMKRTVEEQRATR